MDGCLFCQIVKKEIPAKILFESENLIVFPDISPSADTHLLIVPKEHISGLPDLNSTHKDLLLEIYSVANQQVLENGLDQDLYRVVVNGGKAQHIPHLHFHLLGGQWKKMV